MQPGQLDLFADHQPMGERERQRLLKKLEEIPKDPDEQFIFINRGTWRESFLKELLAQIKLLNNPRLQTLGDILDGDKSRDGL